MTTHRATVTTLFRTDSVLQKPDPFGGSGGLSGSGGMSEGFDDDMGWMLGEMRLDVLSDFTNLRDIRAYSDGAQRLPVF
jgi:hypothetical protein